MDWHCNVQSITGYIDIDTTFYVVYNMSLFEFHGMYIASFIDLNSIIP